MSASSISTTSARARNPQFDFPHRVWRLFTSVKFALIMILILVLLTFIGTAISQIPPPMRADSSLVERWVGAMQARYGAFTTPLYQIGFLDMYTSLPFRLVLGILTVAVCICTINRAPNIWRNIHNVTYQRRVAYYQAAEHHAHAARISASAESTSHAIAAAWRSLGYRVLIEEGREAVHLYADKYRFARLTTFVNHLGLIMILSGGALTGIFGARNDGFVVPIGSTRAVGLGTNYSVKLDNFTDEYYLTGGAKDYRSEVVVFEGDRELSRATVRVNEPLYLGPVKLHQAYFGQAIVVDVKKNGRTIFQDSVPLAYTAIPYGFRAVGFFRLPSEGLNIDLVAAEDAADPAVRAGQVAIFGYKLGSEDPSFGGLLTQRQVQRWEDLEFTFVRETQFSGFQAVRDPGAPVFFIAAALMLSGILGVFYFPHRRLFGLVQHTPDGSCSVWLSGLCSRNVNFPQEFRTAVDKTEKAIASEITVGVGTVDSNTNDSGHSTESKGY